MTKNGDTEQPSPAGEGATWLPTAPTVEHGTRDLIDSEVLDIWNQARAAAAQNNTIQHKATRRRAQRDLRRATDEKIDQLLTSIAHGPDSFGIAPPDAFALTVTDVEMLQRIGMIRPDTNPDVLTGNYLKPGATVGIWIFVIGILVSMNLSGNGGEAFAIFTVAALLTAAPMILVKREKLRTLIEDGPSVELHNGEKATSVTVGRNPALAQLMRDVHQVATGWDDPIWGFYTEIAALADEAGRSLYGRGLDDEKAAVYNQSIAALVDNLHRMIHRRQATAAARQLSEREAAYRELTEHPDNGEDAELLAARLNEVIRGAEEARRDLAE